MKSTRIGIFVPSDLRDKIKKIAEKNTRTMVEQLKAWVKQENNEKN
jgi:hypothetical protein